MINLSHDSNQTCATLKKYSRVHPLQDTSICRNESGRGECHIIFEEQGTYDKSMGEAEANPFRDKCHSACCASHLTRPNHRTKLTPRHISSLESRTHSTRDRLAKANSSSKSYFDSANNSSQAIELAVNISQYQLRDRASLQKHSENVRSSLEHRLQVARERENARLVALLLAELKQLQTNI